MLKVLFPLIILTFFIKEEQKDIIVWDENRLLTWDDFRGKPQRRFAAASTHYDMYKTTEEKGKAVEVKVEAVFLCNKSWKKLSWCSPSVLAHEQKHFDIDELYARKLRKLIKEGKYSSFENLKTVSDSLYNVIDKEMDVYQDKYDDETDGSMNGEKQREWMKKITAEIEELSAYKNTTFTVPFSK
ncbi:MAG TPA: hypothetical protein VN026_04900 [Bacteroidia bacterium]|jgi:hypothetical protein|nr:hypothetical protein [Bacteroidia bacterium]